MLVKSAIHFPYNKTGAEKHGDTQKEEPRKGMYHTL